MAFIFIVTQPMSLLFLLAIIFMFVTLWTARTIPGPDRFFPKAVLRLSTFLWSVDMKKLIHHVYSPFISIQIEYGRYIFSFFLDLLSGYGYKPGRSFFWYLIAVLGFTISYSTFGHLPLFPDAFIFSLTSFHGRGFFPGLGNGTSLQSSLVELAAIEAVIGLFIEISFIATFTQRFFGK